MKCPICKKDVAKDAPHAPFCSERCRIIDLGNWASEKYRIPVTSPQEDPSSRDEEDEQ